MSRHPPPLCQSAARHRNAFPFLAILGLIAWLAPPLTAAVIDDFSGPRKFRLFAHGNPEYEVNGEMRLQLAKAEEKAGDFAAFWYLRNYDLPEQQPVEFQLDVVSLNVADTYACLSVGFICPPGLPRTSVIGYDLAWLQRRVVVAKEYGADSCTFLDTGHPLSTQPVTMALTLTRQGNSMSIGVKVVQRDAPEHVVYSGKVTDGPIVDGPGDDGGPPLGPVVMVGVKCSAVGGSQTRAEAVLDNLTCSSDPTPVVLTVARQATGDPGIQWRDGILLEANELEGPWKPCLQVIQPRSGVCSCRIPLSGPSRFFRVALGGQVLDAFDGVEWSWASWKTASPVPGQLKVPVLTQSNGRGRIVGRDAFNGDFVLFWGGGDWPRQECVASVDILAWDKTMEDAAFGLLLRVKPEKEFWFCETDGLPQQRYAGLLTFKKAGSPSESVLSITGPGGEVLEMRRFPVVDPQKRYRLQFWAVGDRLTLELFDLDNLQIPVETCAATDGRIPVGADALYGTKSVNGTFDVTIDRFFVTGSWP